MNERELNALKCKVASMLGWNIRDFELIRSGKKSGRPNWEVEHYNSHNRYAFTAFDEADIEGLHEVRN